MVKDLFYKLSYGCNKSALSNKELKIITDLESLGLLHLHKDVLKVSKENILGVIDLPKNSNSKNQKNSVAYLTPIAGRNDKDPIINGRDLHGAKDGDIVIGKIIGSQRGRKKAKVVYVAHVGKPDLIGVAIHDGKKILIKEFFTKNTIHTTSRQKALKTLPRNSVLSVDGNTHEIKEILGVLDDPFVDEKIVLKRYERHEEFSDRVINESVAFGEEVYKDLYPNRKDLTHLPFVTIDPVTAKDYDDAVYYDKDKNVLYVAIADVTEYVREFSALDSEAKKRGFTIYFPHKSIPMLPRVLSENLCSLNERVDRLVFVFQIHLDQSGRVEKFKLFEGIIHSRRRFTYEEVDEILDNPNNSPKKDKEFLESLLPLKDLILLLRSKRLAHGYNFRTPDVDIQLDRELKFKEAVKAEETISHQLIEECMLLANICAASYFNYGIFRTHPTPDFNAISRLDSELADIGIFPDKTNDIHKKVLSIQEQADKLEIRETVDKMIIKSLKRAEYTYENVGHFGLGFERYTHFTSPIRRYSDLILHRLLKSIISKDKKQEKYINSQLPYTTKLITSLEGETTKIAWDYEDLVFVRWSKENEKKEFQGIVTDLGDKNKDTIVKLEEGAFGARVFCKFEKNLRLAPFDKVKVRIKKAVLIGIKTFGEISEVL